MLYTVISANRPANVRRMAHLLPDAAVWVVPLGQGGEYKTYGAEHVVECRSTQVTHQRNTALEIADHGPVCMVDDDLKKLTHLSMRTGTKTDITVVIAATLIHARMVEAKAFYGGVGPTDNAFFVKHETVYDKFIRSALIVVQPSGLRYDDDFPLKEDYDFTCQHLARDGVAVRCDDLLARFTYKTNRGGCQEYRSEEMERTVIRRLLTKWPGKIRENKRRPNEVLLRW